MALYGLGSCQNKKKRRTQKQDGSQWYATVICRIFITVYCIVYLKDAKAFAVYHDFFPTAYINNIAVIHEFAKINRVHFLSLMTI